MSTCLSLIQSCFGMTDRTYGGHQLERKNARDMLEAASREGVTWHQIEDAARDFLQREGKSAEHIERQIASMRKTEHLLP